MYSLSNWPKRRWWHSVILYEFNYKHHLPNGLVICITIGKSSVIASLQYIHFIPVPVNRTYASAWLYMDNMSKKKKYAKDIHQSPTQFANQNYVQLWSHSCIHAQETGWQSDVGSYIMPGLSTHSVQGLNAVTVYTCVRVERDRGVYEDGRSLFQLKCLHVSLLNAFPVESEKNGNSFMWK